MADTIQHKKADQTDDDGSVGEIPDSLKTAFKTKNGRTVYDGGGIEPDINVEQETMSSIIISLIRERLIFDYATEYRFANDSIDEAIDFLFSDKDFEDFERFLSDKEYEYTTQTEEKIRELKRVAEEELYYTEISDEYNELIMKLEEKKKDDLNKFKDEIKAIIASEIVSRYYYQKGRIIANLKYDDDIKAAINILKNNNKYNSILNGI